VTCGTGLQARNVFCLGSDGSTQEEKFCFGIRNQKDAGSKVTALVTHGRI
jgi:hypothetical protein